MLFRSTLVNNCCAVVTPFIEEVACMEEIISARNVLGNSRQVTRRPRRRAASIFRDESNINMKAEIAASPRLIASGTLYGSFSLSLECVSSKDVGRSPQASSGRRYFEG